MRKLWALLPGLCLALISLNAKADSTLTFNSVPGGGDIGPYSMTLNPGNANLLLFCMNDTRFINSGETWTVDVIQGSQLSSNSLTKSQAGSYEEEAYILSQLGAFDDTAVQDALWAVFDSNDVNSLTGNAKTLYDDAIGSDGATFITNGEYDNYTFYIYNGDSITGRNSSDSNYDPQNFIGTTPEPSSLLLLGSGLVGLAGAARRKFRRA